MGVEKRRGKIEVWNFGLGNEGGKTSWNGGERKERKMGSDEGQKVRREVRLKGGEDKGRGKRRRGRQEVALKTSGTSLSLQ